MRRHPVIQCPDCHIKMVPNQCREAVIDKCPSCQGIWFDKSELGIFRDSLENVNFDTIEVSEPEADSAIIVSNCPHCRIILSESIYAYNTGVTLKNCGQCLGIWLTHPNVIKFIDMVKLVKDLRPDVIGATQEWKKFYQDAENLRKFQKSMEFLHRPIRYRYRLPYFMMPIPLYDENPRLNFHWVTSLIILFNIFIYVLTAAQPTIFLHLGLVPGDSILSQYMTHFFMHAGIMHLLSNMFFLWTFGDNVEDRFGPLKFLFFYLGAGILVGVFDSIIHPSSLTPRVGASGAISAVMGAYLCFFPHVRLKVFMVTHIIDVPVYAYLIGWFALQSFFSMLNHSIRFANVNYLAHFLGFVGGYLVALIYVKTLSQSRD